VRVIHGSNTSLSTYEWLTGGGVLVAVIGAVLWFTGWYFVRLGTPSEEERSRADYEAFLGPLQRGWRWSGSPARWLGRLLVAVGVVLFVAGVAVAAVE
jgi:hypothetical protein